MLVSQQQAGVEAAELQPLRDFTTFAAQDRFDDEPEELGLLRTAWCKRADAMQANVQSLLNRSQSPATVNKAFRHRTLRWIPAELASH